MKLKLFNLAEDAEKYRMYLVSEGKGKGVK